MEEKSDARIPGNVNLKGMSGMDRQHSRAERGCFGLDAGSSRNGPLRGQ